MSMIWSRYRYRALFAYLQKNIYRQNRFTLTVQHRTIQKLSRRIISHLYARIATAKIFRIRNWSNGRNSSDMTSSYAICVRCHLWLGRVPWRESRPIVAPLPVASPPPTMPAPMDSVIAELLKQVKALTSSLQNVQDYIKEMRKPKRETIEVMKTMK